MTDSTNTLSHETTPARGTTAEVFGVFLKLGLTSFGGPIAHLGYFRSEFVERRRWLDGLISNGALLLYGTPPFWLAMLLIVLFSVKLDWLPAFGMQTVAADLSGFAWLGDRLRHLVLGAMVGATMFTLGKLLLAWYLSTAAVVSAYGAAGSLVVLLMWIYFSSAILLFSASCAQALEQDSARASAREPAV